MRARTGSSGRLDWKRPMHSLFIPASSPPVGPATPDPPIRQPGPPSQPSPLQSPAVTPAPPLRLPFLPCLLWHPFLLFILPNWRPTPEAPQCAPHPVQQILRKARPALAQPPPPGGGMGRAGRRSCSPGAPRVSSADRAGWAGPPGGREAGGARRRGRFPGVAAAGAVPGPGSPSRPGPARANS